MMLAQSNSKLFRKVRGTLSLGKAPAPKGFSQSAPHYIEFVPVRIPAMHPLCKRGWRI